MKKRFFPAILLFFLGIEVLLNGCSTASVERVEVYSGPLREKHTTELIGTNYAYYLFGFIPIFCGNPHRPNKKDYYIFRDELTVENNNDMLKSYAKYIDDISGLEKTQTSVSRRDAFSLFLVREKKITTKAKTIPKAAVENNEEQK